MPSVDQPPETEAPNAEAPLEEVQGEQIVDLPSREALSVVDPGALGLGIPLPFARAADQSPTAGGAPQAAAPER
jgi:hypothetical protein